MTEAIIKGKAVKLNLNWRTLREFGNAMGYKTPTEATSKLLLLSSSNVTDSWDAMDVFAVLLYQMALRGNVGELTLDDCYDSFIEKLPEVLEPYQKELSNFMGDPESIKKKDEEKEQEMKKE